MTMVVAIIRMKTELKLVVVVVIVSKVLRIVSVAVVAAMLVVRMLITIPHYKIPFALCTQKNRKSWQLKQEQFCHT